MREPLSVVDIFVAGEPPEHRLPKQSNQRVTPLLAAAAVEELGDRDIGEPESAVELAVYASRPPSEVILAPWNSSLIRRSKSTRRGSTLASPIGYATIAPLYPHQVSDLISKIARVRHQVFDSFGESGNNIAEQRSK